MADVTTYGDISPAVAAWAQVQMLKRAVPYLHFERFGQTYTLPTTLCLRAESFFEIKHYDNT